MIKRGLAGFLAVLLAVAVVPPLLNVNRYRSDVAEAISRAVGRRVTVGEVELRVLPQPGFALSNFVVSEDPAFGAEPVLRAADVVASLRLSSLWRGRLEIAKLSLSYASLNLVRRPDGAWNLESLLERATHSDIAPTGNRAFEARTRFPYVEGEGGRINLKLGQEKTAYSLSEADFALWLASEKEWRVRLTARPVRTDDNLSDAGTIILSGSFGSAADLSDTPVSMQLTLEKAQLGQFTRLIYGRDIGWRGALDASAVLRGTPAALRATWAAAVNDVHRFDSSDMVTLGVGVRCSGLLASTEQAVRELKCSSTSDIGSISAGGWAQWRDGSLRYDFTGEVQDLPAGRVLAAVRLLNQAVPQDLSTAGSVNASFAVRDDPEAGLSWSGRGDASGVVLSSSRLSTPVELGPVQFELATPAPASRRSGSRSTSARDPQPRTLNLAPFAVQLGGSTPVTSQGWFSPAGYHVVLQGSAESARTLELARTLGLPVPEAQVRGAASLNFEIAGKWDEADAPTITGTARLKSVTARLQGLQPPVVIHSGTLVVAPQTLTLKDADFGVSGSSLRLAGMLRKPRNCSVTFPAEVPDAEASSAKGLPEDGRQPGVCLLEFQLAAKKILASDLYSVLNPPSPRRAWYRMLGSGNREVSPLLRVTAAGRLKTEAFEGGEITASQVVSDLEIGQGVLLFKRLRGKLLDGTHQGELRADFTGPTPAYTWRGELRQIAVDQLRLADDVDWGGVEVTIRGGGTATGWSAEELKASADLDLAVDWRDGMLAGYGLAGTGEPLAVRRLTGQLKIEKGTARFTATRVQLADGEYELSGSVQNHQLELTLAPVDVPGQRADDEAESDEFRITGRLDKPTIVALPLRPAAARLVSKPIARDRADAYGREPRIPAIPAP